VQIPPKVATDSSNKKIAHICFVGAQHFWLLLTNACMTDAPESSNGRKHNTSIICW
jgi:hypothetical protein